MLKITIVDNIINVPVVAMHNDMDRFFGMDIFAFHFDRRKTNNMNISYQG